MGFAIHASAGGGMCGCGLGSERGDWAAINSCLIKGAGSVDSLGPESDAGVGDEMGGGFFTGAMFIETVSTPGYSLGSIFTTAAGPVGTGLDDASFGGLVRASGPSTSLLETATSAGSVVTLSNIDEETDLEVAQNGLAYTPSKSKVI